MTVGCLGERSYDVRFVRRATTLGPALARGEAPVVSGRFERQLSSTSDASATFALTGTGASECVQLLASIEPWRDEMELYGDGELCWAGPVMDVSADPQSGLATVTARDLSAWWERRVLTVDVVSRQLDLATIFESYLTAAFAVDDPGIVVVTSPTGILGDRTVAASDAKLLSGELAELARTGCDWTVANRTFWIGGVEVSPAARLPGRLVDESFREAPTTRRTGVGQTNDAWVRGNKVVGHYGGADSQDGVLLSDVSSETSIEDQGSADAAARSWWDRAHEPLSYVEGANALDPSAHVALDELLPGLVVGVDLSGGGVVPLFDELRLERVSVDFDADSESVQIALQPIGTTAQGGG